MARAIPEPGKRPVARQAGGVAHDPPEPRVIRMLVFQETRRQDDARPQPPDDFGKLQGVLHALLQERIPVQDHELQGRPKDRGGFPGLERPLPGRAVRRRLPPGTDNQMRGTPRLRFACDDASAAKFNVVGMGAEYEQGRRLKPVFQ